MPKTALGQSDPCTLDQVLRAAFAKGMAHASAGNSYEVFCSFFPPGAFFFTCISTTQHQKPQLSLRPFVSQDSATRAEVPQSYKDDMFEQYARLMSQLREYCLSVTEETLKHDQFADILPGRRVGATSASMDVCIFEYKLLSFCVSA
jgi:hypothetical protein